jgi:hypothetical protein
VGEGEGEEGGAGWGAQLPDGLVAMGVEAAALTWREGRVFDPESELAVGADGGDEVGVDGRGEPLDLILVSIVKPFGRRLMMGRRSLLGLFLRYVLPMCRRDSKSRLCADCRLLSCHQRSWMRSDRRRC